MLLLADYCGIVVVVVGKTGAINPVPWIEAYNSVVEVQQSTVLNEHPLS
jgi:hypothetical protein